MKKKSVILCSSQQSVGVSLGQDHTEQFWYVQSVDPNSLADTSQIQVGDILHSINFNVVHNEVEIEHELSQRPPVVLQFISPQAFIPHEQERQQQLVQNIPPLLQDKDEDEDDARSQEPTMREFEFQKDDHIASEQIRTRVVHSKQELQRVSNWLQEFTSKPVNLSSKEDKACSRPIVIIVEHLLDNNNDEEQAAVVADILACCIGYLLRTPLRGDKTFMIQDLIASPQLEDDNSIGNNLFDWVVQHVQTTWKDCSEIQLASDVAAVDAHRFFIAKGMNITGFTFTLNT